MNDSLGNRMKLYESLANHKLMPGLPVLVRLDGVAFHTFTKGLERPYDIRLSQLMVATTKHLVSLSGANIGYTQSDEISLLFHTDNRNTQLYYDSKTFKMVSILAAKATLFFNQHLQSAIPDKVEFYPVFDCRVWTVPSKIEAVNSFIWREKDAVRNSVTMAAQSFYSHKELHKKTSSQKQEMLFQKGINWNNYPTFFKRGTYIQKRTISRPFTDKEIENLPPKHEARLNPNLEVVRNDYIEIDMPPLTKISNSVEVLFDGANPIGKS